MINKLFFVGLLLITAVVHAEKPAGFLWYNVPKEAKHQKKGTPFSQLSYTDKDAVLHFYTMEALHKVRFTHQLEDERVFLALQNYWLKEASIHGIILSMISRSRIPRPIWAPKYMIQRVF